MTGYQPFRHTHFFKPLFRIDNKNSSLNASRALAVTQQRPIYMPDEKEFIHGVGCSKSFKD